MKITSEAARRFLVAHHLLAPARSLEGGPDAVLEVFRRFGSIQFDPIAVAGRNHDLVLHARVADYDPAWCDLLYERREIFEAFNKDLALVPTGEFPWFRALRSEGRAAHPRRARRGRGAGTRAHPRRGAALGARLRASIRTCAGMGMGDVERRACRARGLCGHRRARARRSRRQPPLLRPPRATVTRRPARAEDSAARATPAQDAFALPRARSSRHRAAGDVLAGLGPAKPDPERPENPGRTALRDELVESGELVRVTVEGLRGPRFVLREEIELLSAPPEPPASAAFLPPMDPLMWDRSLLQPLFDFDWVWEVFTPEHKRRWGYYVLPILFRDRLVGRIEPRIDADARVRVLGLWWEEGFRAGRTEGFVDAMRVALGAYLRFAGADRLEWAPHLDNEKRLFRSRW